MPKVFIDSDVLLDVLARRLPFYFDSAAILSLAERKSIEAFTTSIVIANIFYILRKIKTKVIAIERLRKLRIFISIIFVTENIIDKALVSNFKNFEDAIQYFASSDNELGFIITRNKADYKQRKITVCTPTEFLEIVNSQKSN